MNLLKGMLINLVLLVVMMTPASALTGARLLGLSKSGQTALFNLGTHDGVKEGDYAVIVKEIRSLDLRDLRLVPVAKARNVKMNTGHSVWILFKTYDVELLVKGHDYLVLSESAMLSGRRDPRFGRISVITEKDKAAFQTQNVLADNKDRISKLKTHYPEIESLHEKESRTNQDIELVDVEVWNKNKGSKYRTALYKSPHQKDFQRELRLTTFEKMVTAYLLKINDPKFNYDEFYDEQRKSHFANEFRQRSNFSTEYEKFPSTQGQKAISDAKLYRSLLEKGESWSENFSDEDLRVMMNEVSVLQEKHRREYISSNHRRYMVSLGYGLPLTDDQTEKDTFFRREASYAIDVDFEGIPVFKHETLERFTLNGSFRRNRSAFGTGALNASLNEHSFTGGANRYPLYPSYTLEAPVVFFGVYFRSGWAAVEAPAVGQKSNYTVLSLPGMRAGMRYNLRNQFGIRVAFNLETLNLDRYEQSSLSSSLPGKERIVEAQINMAIAYAF